MASAKMLRALFGVVLTATLWGSSARAQISGAAVPTTGSSCGAGNTADQSCAFSSQILTNNGTTLATRYAWNINTDIGAFSTADMSGSAHHNVDFSATAPGGYRLNITTSRQGDINRISDLLNCEGSADVSGVTGSSNVALSSGSLSLADPGGLGVGGSDTSIAINQGTGVAQIFRVSNGAPQAHNLDFTWSGNTRSNSCETAVRIGAGNATTTGCSACEYPGSPARTQATDGHFVTVTYTSLCGNHVIDAAVSEACDEGSANGTFTSCCNTNCTLKSSSTACRSSSGPCDVVENCTGASPTCPADAFASTAVVCRGSAGVCDLAENCTGTGPGCPFDFKAGPTVTCRPSAGVCDTDEVCNGSSNTCPTNAFSPSTTVCRGSAGICDVAENCTGSSAACPANGFASSSTQCRGSAGVCDLAEFCTGGGAACPANGFVSSSTVCRGASDVCDVAENCTGGTAACPADAVESAGTECRATAGVCDQAEECDGVAKACPSDSAAGAFVVCRPSAGICDQVENCDGVNNDCPADGKKATTTVCRPASGVCDVADHCDGANDACPADGFASTSTQCRGAAGACDVAEFCTGGGPACPADGFAPSTQECRGDAGQCDVADNCTGSGPACPADAFEPNGTGCDDGNACVVGEACQGGVCTGGVGEVCGACETCVPGTGCEEVPRTDCFLATEPLRSKILIKDTTPDLVDKVIWKWIRGEAVANADFGDPVAADDYAFCLYDSTGIVMQASIPAGGTCGTKPCWKALNGKGYKYVSKDGAASDGVNKLLLKAGGAGLSKVIMKGKGANLLMPTLPLSLEVQAEIRGAGKCWSTIHTPLGTSRNDAFQFKSKDGS